VGRYLARTAAASLVWPIPEFGLDTRIHRVSCPVTLVWGGADRIAPPSYLERFRARLPNVVSAHVVDGAGHLADWDRPDEVASIVAAALGGA
jgi:pimeloyl-ACP methyl ester carboxylesterase